MIVILILGILFTTLTIGVLYIGFQTLRKQAKWQAQLNTREANKKMLQIIIIVYLTGIIATITLMANY